MIVALVVVVLIVALVGETPQMRNRRLGLFASSSEEETLYCCAVGIPSRMDEKKLNSLKSWYQIPDDLTLIWSSVVNGAVILILG